MAQNQTKTVSMNTRIFHVEGKDSGLLIGSKCEACGIAYFPQRTICPKCFRDDTLKPVPLSKQGRLYSFTIIRRQSLCPPGFTAPYCFGYVDLPEGTRVMTLIEGELDSLKTGDDMKLASRPVCHDKEGNEVIWYSFVSFRH